MCANACLGDFMVRQCAPVSAAASNGKGWTALEYKVGRQRPPAAMRSPWPKLMGKDDSRAASRHPRAAQMSCVHGLRSWPPIQEPLIPLKQRFVTLRLHLGDKGAHTRGYVLGP